MVTHSIPLHAVKAAAHYKAQDMKRKTMTERAIVHCCERGESVLMLVLDAMDCAARAALFDQFKIAKSREIK